ncbi:MAG: heavy metal-binding domain-containing protein [Chloroflexi bacterium]|nr:heavy metal-binding domain-containing protein [Chloroflexota bacterium]
METTTRDVPGREMTEVPGVVRGNSGRARHVGRDLMAGFRNYPRTH